ncbi:hypothetical protein AF332_07975 [Sporosarcina globispora]|uniref:Uncharacterized protein n=1 Tax=Sporosarcina globispora TaxID=1459 RepID=A0A0M0GB30_SPOGL|nr:hypothetical protein [Sporosarcina globispora]KON86737.1 hypothetical protein AF332_07975 [Sporosarcina globispora]
MDTVFYIAELIVAEGILLLREVREEGDPAGEAEEAPIPPRGKQVPAAEINGHHLFGNKNCKINLKNNTTITN